MSPIILFSYVILWLLVLVMSWTLLRLLQRLQPVKKLMMEDRGMPIGTVFPDLKFLTPDRDYMTLEKNGRPKMIVFVSNRCEACKQVIPILTPYQQKRKDLQVIMLAWGVYEEIVRIGEEFDVNIPIGLISPAQYEMLDTKITPYCYFVDANGVIRAKSVVNDEEHLETVRATGARNAVSAQAG